MGLVWTRFYCVLLKELADARCSDYQVNSLIWRQDAIDRAPVWCDISAKVRCFTRDRVASISHQMRGQIIVAYEIACLCAAFSIARFVARAVAPGMPQLSSNEIRRQNHIDLAICIGVPLLTMATHIVYQPNRYAISRTTGCAATYVVTWPTFVLWLIWPPLVAVVSAGYASMFRSAPFFVTQSAKWAGY